MTKREIQAIPPVAKFGSRTEIQRCYDSKLERSSITERLRYKNQRKIEIYRKTFDKAIEFAKNYPDTLWCYGNHDVSYPWGRLETAKQDCKSISE